METPPIHRWREHLPRMVNSYYCVEDIKARFLECEFFETTVRLTLSTRYYDIKFNDMPEVLRHWIPVTEDGIRAYNHIAVEAGEDPDDRLPMVVPNAAANALDKLQAIFLEGLEDDLHSIQAMKEAARDARVKLKDVTSGSGGANYVNQAKAIAALIKTQIDADKAKMEKFKLAMNLFGLDKKAISTLMQEKMQQIQSGQQG